MMSSLKSLMVVGTYALMAPFAAQATGMGNISYTSTGACSVSDLASSADACIGVVLGSDDSEFKDDMSPFEANFNLDSFDGTLGMFGRTDWSFLGRVSPATADAGTSYTEDGVTVSFGATSTDPDTWSTSNDLSDFAYAAIVLKQSTGFSAYLYDGNAPSSGEWSSAAFGQKASFMGHLSIYTGPSIPIVPTPLPAGGILLVSAFAFMALRRRR